jgi:hypothetical protein
MSNTRKKDHIVYTKLRETACWLFIDIISEGPEKPVAFPINATNAHILRENSNSDFDMTRATSLSAKLKH